jgi:hypothetical protein
MYSLAVHITHIQMGMPPEDIPEIMSKYTISKNKNSIDTSELC